MYSPSDFPRSYAENSPRENLVLAYAENFRKQYTHLYRDRKPLLLNPLNELNVEVISWDNVCFNFYNNSDFVCNNLVYFCLKKFVCTTVFPTKLPFKELYAWERSAEFVSDYLNFVPLDPPFQIVYRYLLLNFIS